MAQRKQWTLMFYLASDNPLAPGVVSQLKSIKSAGFHKEANVIVQFDPYTEDTPTHVFDVNGLRKTLSSEAAHIGFKADSPYVYNLLEDRLWGEEKDHNDHRIRDLLIHKYIDKGFNPPKPPARKAEMDPELGPKESLQEFLKFCADKYPAEHYMLFILGHGLPIGTDLFLYDEHGYEHSLSVKGLSDVLSYFTQNIEEPGKLELVSFHSCSVSSLEIAHELKDYTNYILASQGTTFVGSWPYRQILVRIFNSLEPDDDRGQDTIPDLLNDIFDYCVHNSTDFLLAGYPFDLCLCDLTKLQEIRSTISGLSRALCDALKPEAVPNPPAEEITNPKPTPFTDSILLAHLKSQSFHEEMYTDIVDFCRCLYRRMEQPVAPAAEPTRAAIKAACKDVIDAIGKSIVRAGFAGPEYQYSKGLSIYFPWSQPLDDVWDRYKVHQINATAANEVSWADFLAVYFETTRRESISVEAQKPITELGEGPSRTLSTDEELLADEIALVYSQATPQLNQGVIESLKRDSTDPLDGECSCPSVKNYPRDTRARIKRPEHPGPVPVNPGFLQKGINGGHH